MGRYAGKRCELLYVLRVKADCGYEAEIHQAAGIVVFPRGVFHIGAGCLDADKEPDSDGYDGEDGKEPSLRMPDFTENVLVK